jgi:hypothetical protein
MKSRVEKTEQFYANMAVASDEQQWICGITRQDVASFQHNAVQRFLLDCDVFGEPIGIPINNQDEYEQMVFNLTSALLEKFVMVPIVESALSRAEDKLNSSGHKTELD